MIPPDRSIREQLVDERALALAEIPGYLLEALPSPAPVRYGVPRADRFLYEPRRATGIMDVLELGEDPRAAGGYQGASRPSHGHL